MRLLLVGFAAAAASLVGLPKDLPSQVESIARRVEAVRDGVVSLHFASRPGICVDGNGSTWTPNRPIDAFRGTCVAGPIRVTIGRADNATVSVRVNVGDSRLGDFTDTNLGFVASPDAARYLLGLARIVRGRSAGEAISGATLADSVDLSPELTTLVRDENIPIDTRQQALFWLGQTQISTPELSRLYDDLKPFALREHFVFVISQRRNDSAIQKLIDIASHDANSDIRKQAMFWLGQTNDPRALKFLRDIVTR